MALSISAVTEQGNVRPHQEDRYSILTPFMLDIDGTIYTMHVAGVFDGHGGEACVEYVSQRLLTYFKKECLRQQSLTGLLSIRALRNIISTSFQDVNTEFLQQHPEDMSGTTATIVIHAGCEIHSSTTVSAISCHCHCHTWVACVGDSSAFVQNDEEAVNQVIQDHNTEHAYEVNRISMFDDYGGIRRKYAMKKDQDYGLAVTRSFGDRRFDFVQAEPEITYLPQHEWKRLIIATDGLWDVVCGEEAMNYDDPYVLMCYRNYKYKQHDNVTIMFIEKKEKNTKTRNKDPK